MSISVQGLGVSPGIVIGKAHMFERDQLDISEYSIEPHDVVKEVHRFENALTLAREAGTPLDPDVVKSPGTASSSADGRGDPGRVSGYIYQV
ncbi:MAG: phosphoenolpyruvate-utilizing N-terminal domain-containing protein [Gammaproteobacteria bacterium]